MSTLTIGTMTIGTMTIGMLARKAGVGVETIRFYERKGLIPEPRRRRSGYREYSDDAVARIRFIHRAKELGFTLREIAGLLSLRVAPGTACSDVKLRAERKIRDIEERIRMLERMRTVLRCLTAACQDAEPTGPCPILEALEER